MDIRPADLSDDALLEAMAAVAHRSIGHERPWAPAFDEPAWVAQVRATDSGEHQELVVATEGDRVLGFAIAWLFLLDNLDVACVDVEVDPPARRQGAGSALAEHVVAYAGAQGRTTVLADTKVPFDRVEDHPARRFAQTHGFTLSNIEVVRHQALPVPEADLDAWADRTTQKAAGYRVETFVNEVPEELQESLCVLLGQLGVDAPTGAVDFEEEVMTPERLAERQATAEAMGRDIFETLAITPDGVVAAQSTLAVPRRHADAFQWGTFVHREHRGHSLGLAVKVANQRELQRRHPHIRRVVTQNAETNGWMIAINELMGYRPVEAAVELVRRL